MKPIIKGVVIGTVAMAAVAGITLSVATPARADASQAKGEIVLSLGLLKSGNFNAARAYAQKAIKADPSWGLAHAVLARTYLALGDGVGAESELTRAAANGFDMKRAVIMADGKHVTAADLDLGGKDEPDPINLKAIREVADRKAIRHALARAEGNISNTAKLLGISRPTLYDLLKSYDLHA